MIDYVQDRNGKVIYRTDNRCAVMGNCNAADWDGKAMPRPPSRDRQLLDPMAAFQMVHIMEGVVERGTATVLRDLDRPMFGKTGTTSGPTNVWFVGGTPDVVAGVYIGYDQPRSMGGYAQGGRIAAPIFKQLAQVALQGHAEGAVRGAQRHPLGARRPRDRQARVRHVPDQEDPKSSVIWEAFQPQTEPRRLPPVATRRGPGSSRAKRARMIASSVGRAGAPAARHSRPAQPAARPSHEPADATLQNQAAIY